MSTIASLDITNFQRLGGVKIEPSGNVILLCGKNANGKTSVLDGIQAAWCGHDSRTIKRPIKDGHGKASIDITMTDGTVLTRKYTPSGTTLTAKSATGAKLGQKDLDRMISSLGVDAAAFILAGEKKQLETLLSIVELPFVPAELDAERKAVFDERTGINRDIKQLEAQLSTYGPLNIPLPSEEVSVAELVREYRDGQVVNHNIDVARTARDGWAERVEQLRDDLADAEESLRLATDTLKKSPKPIDVDSIQKAIDNAEETNELVRRVKAGKEVTENLAGAVEYADRLTDELEAIDTRKADGLAAATMPIEGLTFDDEGVLYQGVPFSRASGAEQIIVSAAMIIATNPEVRTMVIRNGNVMDEDSLAVVQSMCEDNNFQAFVEFVSDGTGHEFRLVDGELAS